MKLSWFLFLLVLIFVAIFSVQNADVITVRFMAWEFSLSAALLIQLAALLGVFVGLALGVRARREPAAPSPQHTTPAVESPPADSPPRPGDDVS